MRVLASFPGTGWLVAWTLFLMAGAIEGQSLRRELDWPAGVPTDLRQREYHFSALDGEVWSAPNRAQGLRSRVSRGGLEVFPRTVDASGEGAEWKLRLRTGSFGRVGEARVVECRGVVIHEDRVELDHGLLQEWLVNDARGIEQGWTIASRPAGSDDDPLWIGLAFGGDLQPRIAGDGRSATLVDANDTVRLHYRDLAAWDANGHDLPARLAPGPEGPGIRVDDRGALYPITVDPTLVLGWTAEGDQVNASFGWSVSTAGDVNGDGYSDLVVGAPFYDHGEEDEGRAFLYMGSPSGLTSVAVWSVEGDQANARLGTSVSTGGDVNRDGFSDVVVGVPRHDGDLGDQGRVDLYLGSPAGLVAIPAWTAEGSLQAGRLGSSVSGAGDVNGDGYSDIIVGAPRYDSAKGRAVCFLGSDSGPSTSVAWSVVGDQDFYLFGNSVSSAGDVNGDGYADVIVGWRYTDTAHVFLGSSSGLSTTAAWIGGDRGYFGRSVSTAGDVNGDGYSDVIVGADSYYGAEANEGRAFLYLGSPAGLSAGAAWIAGSDQEGAHFGYSVASAGDVNGDGYSDVLVGSYGFDNGQQDEGRASLYFGSAEGLSATPDWTAESDHEGANFGACVSTAGDVDGDGFSDIVVGAYGYENGEAGEGGVFVYHGSGSLYLLEPDASRIVHGDQEDAYLGYSLSTEGDVNGDGYSDLLVGAPNYDTGQENEGRVFVYLGSAAGLAPYPVWTMDGARAYDYFGWSVSMAGDVDGDGYGDVLVGSIGFDDENTNEGRVFLFPGSVSGPSTSASWTADGDQAGALMGWSVARAGDVDGDGFGDVLVGAVVYDDTHADEGRVWLFRGSTSGLSPDPAWIASGGQATARFGECLATAGDVNADGYSDVVVGAPLYDGDHVDEGCALVYLGSPVGLSPNAAWFAEGDQDYAAFGACVATAGDVNGDGNSDLLVGAEFYDLDGQDKGRVYLYQGSASGLSESPVWTAEGTQEFSFFGASASTAGDLNADGYSDVVIGAYCQDAGEENEGVVLVYLGSAEGLSGLASWTAESDQLGAYFGFGVTAGDVNGDGYSDVLAGAIHLDTHGGVYVFLGNEGRAPRIRALRQLQPDGSTPIALLGRSTSLRSFSITAEVPSGPIGATAFLEWEVEPLGVPFDGLDLQRSPVGQPVSLLALPLTFEETVLAESWTDRPLCWRARVVFVGGIGGRTPWFSLPGNAPTEAKLRFRQPEKRIRRRTTVPLDGNR